MNGNQVNIDEVVSNILGSVPQTQTTVVKLPSLGKMYGLKSEHVTVRGMTFDDEKALLGAKTKGQSVDLLISRCVQEDINPRELIPQDKIYLVVTIRALSMGDNYNLNVVCGSCSHKNKIEVDVLNVFKCNYPEKPLEFIREIELPKIKKKAKIRVATSSELEEPPEKVYSKLVNFVTEIDGRQEYVIIDAVLKKLPIEDMHEIIKNLSYEGIGLDTRFRFKCSNCHKEEETEVSISQDFFTMR